MDQKKIGRYIADKRKSLNLTQVQLAEQLGMSDKSVSKWERGVCLPDVSVYKPLCDALEISINEFLAGEDIPEEIIADKSEHNIIQIIKDNKTNKQKMKRVIAILTAIVLAVSAVMVYMLIKDGKFMMNYIMPVPSDSPEIAVAEMITNTDAYLYRFSVEDKYNNIRLKLYTYENGTLTDASTISDDTFFEGYDGKGMITIISYDDGSVKAVVSASGGSAESEMHLVNKEGTGDWFSVSADRPDEEVRIDASSEVGLLALTYDFDAHCSSISVDIQDDGFWPKGKEYIPELKINDYTFFITVEFGITEQPE